MMGRPAKLTPERQAKIVQAIRLGNTRECAAKWAGVGRSTLLLWLARGRKERERLEQPGARKRRSERIYLDLLAAVEKAEADAEAAMVGHITKAVRDGQWTAAAWWLERRYPEKWGRKDRLSVEGRIEQVKIELVEPPPAEEPADG
jgi:transposase